VDDRFDMSDDFPAELQALKTKLDSLEFRRAVDHWEAAANRRQDVKQSFFGKLGSLSNTLTQLTRTRRRVEALEDNVAALKDGVLSVIERELSDIAHAARVRVEVTDERWGASQERWGVTEERWRASQERWGATQERWQISERENAKLRASLTELERLFRFERFTRQKAFTDFDRRLTVRARSGAPPEIEAQGPGEDGTSATSTQSLLESFYYLLEDRYRGAWEEIKQRLDVYRNDLRAARDRTGESGLVVDIGCGRGEFLDVFREEGLRSVGVDSNDVQIETARQHGAPVIHGEAHEYLKSLDDNSVLAITGIHIVEHIPFVDLIRLMQETVRVLRPGGLVIFETPNPRNLIVGAHTFNFDPTHIRPLPPEVLEILLETVGLSDIEIRPLHPSDTLEPMVNAKRLDPHIATLLFGPQDYAILGVRR
jgi:SAM-dependent methyltransferase